MIPRVEVIVGTLLCLTPPGVGAEGLCSDILSGGGATLDRVITVSGPTEARVDLPALPSGALLQVIEQGGDVSALLTDGSGKAITRFDAPVARTGIQTASVSARRAPLVLLVRSREHDGFGFKVRVVARVAGEIDAACAGRHRRIAAADSAYANARARTARESEAVGVPADASFESALRLYRAALDAWPGEMSQETRARTELSVASLYYFDLYEWQQSAEWSGRAANAYRAIRDPYGAARAEAVLASAQIEIATASRAASRAAAVPDDSRARFDVARSLLGRIEGFHQARGEAYDAALQTNNIGLTYYLEARFAYAIPPLREAFDSFKRLRDSPRAAVAWQNIALCEWGLGRLRQAMKMFEQALPDLDLEKQSDLYLQASNNLALVSYATGRYDRALRLYEGALADAERTEWDYYRGWSYYGLGVTYYALGNRKMASQFLHSALSLATPEKDARTHIQSLRALAVIAQEEGDYTTALDFFQKALGAATAQTSRANIKIRLAATQAAMGQTVEARQELDALIANPPGGDALIQADARLERGRITVRDSQRRSEALRDFQQAQTIFARTNSINGQYEAQLEIARARMAAGEPSEAARVLSQALRWSGEIENQTANPEYRASLADTLRPARDLMLGLLYASHRRALDQRQHAEARRVALEALGVSDGARARSFGQILAQQYQPKADARTADLLRKRSELQEEMAELRFYLSYREDRDLPTDLHVPQIRAEIARKRFELGVVETELGARANVDARLAAIANRPLNLDLAAIPRHRAYVEFWVGEADAYAWVVTSNDVHWLKIAKADDVRQAARLLHAAMSDIATTPAAVRRERLERMHELVMQPILAAIGSSSEIVIVADGPLHVVPFAALRSAQNREPLVRRAAISFTPALRFTFTANASVPGAVESGRLLIVADPVYRADDERMSRAVVQASPSKRDVPWERLMSSAREADAVVRLFGDSRADRLQGLEATKQRFLALDLSGYRFVHVATHGMVDTEVPQLSSLVFGRFGSSGATSDTDVRVGDLLTLNFSAELMVLSACQTSLGPEFSGEGPVGLRYAALARGARAVISSLWPVDDGISADLMTEVYEEILVNGRGADQALAIAMRRLLDSKRSELDPALWAPYTVYATGTRHEEKATRESS